MAENLYGHTAFRCQRCAHGCCALFKITVTTAEKEAISRLNLPDTLPAEQCFRQEQPGLFTVAKDPRTGDCVFSAGGACRIQQKYGFRAKPAACQLFPLHVRQWADGPVSAEYRWLCPGVGAPDGKPLAEETNLPYYARVLARLRPPENTVFSPSLDPGLPAIRAVHAGLAAILHRPGKAWALRLYCALRVLDFHAAPEMHQVIREAGKAFAEDAADFFDRAESVMLQELAATPPPGAQTRTHFRNMLCGLLRNDVPGKHPLSNRLRRTWSQFRIALGTGSLRDLNPMAPDVPGSFFPVRHYRPVEPEAEKLFADFWFGKLDAMHFCGQQNHGFSYEEGLRHLLLLAVQTRALAEAFAEETASETLRRDAMLRAIRLADFTFSASPFFRLNSSRKWLKQLSRLEAFASLLRF